MRFFKYLFLKGGSHSYLCGAYDIVERLAIEISYLHFNLYFLGLLGGSEVDKTTRPNR